MEWAKLLLEYLKVLTSPQIIVGGIVACFLFRHAKDVRELLSRITKVGSKVLDIETTFQSQAEVKVEKNLSVELGGTPKAAGVTEVDLRLKQLKGVGINNPSVQLREERIRADLKNVKLLLANDEPAKVETVDLLIQHLAFAQAVQNAETVYRTIFGSQIALLKRMNLEGSVGPEILQATYADAASRFPHVYAKYPFQNYLNYLLKNGLIETKDQLQFSITTDGKEFLKWMTEVSVSENKLF
jgi:hypothetical protein